MSPDILLIADASLLVRAEIAFNVGRLDRSIILNIADYIRIAKPRLIDITQNYRIVNAQGACSFQAYAAPKKNINQQGWLYFYRNFFAAYATPTKNQEVRAAPS